MKVLTEVKINVHSSYVREDSQLEDMNGLWRETSELFCEECFPKYAEALTRFYQENKKQPQPIDKK
jgi:hypothetical protein